MARDGGVQPKGEAKGMTALKTLIFTVLIPGTVTVILPYWLRRSALELYPVGESNWRYAGLAPMAMGIAIYFWCAWDFIFTGRGTPAPIDPPKELVVRGLYRYTRNPMYVGIFSILVGEAILFHSSTLLLYALLVLLGFHLWTMYYEEPILRKTFGDSYAHYCARVPRWMPAMWR